MQPLPRIWGTDIKLDNWVVEPEPNPRIESVNYDSGVQGPMLKCMITLFGNKSVRLYTAPPRVETSDDETPSHCTASICLVGKPELVTCQEPKGMVCSIQVFPCVTRSGREQPLSRNVLLDSLVPELAILSMCTKEMAGLRQVGKGDGIQKSEDVMYDFGGEAE